MYATGWPGSHRELRTRSLIRFEFESYDSCSGPRTCFLWYCVLTDRALFVHYPTSCLACLSTCVLPDQLFYLAGWYQYYDENACILPQTKWEHRLPPASKTTRLEYYTRTTILCPAAAIWYSGVLNKCIRLFIYLYPHVCIGMCMYVCM